MTLLRFFMRQEDDTMQLLSWNAKILLGNSLVPVTVNARTYFEAVAMLEAQYGKGSIKLGPTKARIF